MTGPSRFYPQGRQHVLTPKGAQLKSRLAEIAAELVPIAKEGTKEIADSIAEGARERAPFETGALKEAIHVEFEGGGHLGEDLEAVGDWSVVAGDTRGDKEVFYGHIVEHGSVHAAPHPFLVPAAEAEIPSIWAKMAARLKNL